MNLKWFLVFFFCCLSGCSLLGERQWAAYKVIVQVESSTGDFLSEVKLESNEVKTQLTNQVGQATLQFRAPGLHVVTITAKDYETKQIKVHLPQDDSKIFNAFLTAK